MTTTDNSVAADVGPGRRGERTSARGATAGKATAKKPTARRGALGLLGKISLHVVFIGAILAFWQEETASGRLNPLLVPKPSDVVSQIWLPHNSGTILYNVQPTLQALAIGFVIGSIIAFVAAVVFSEIPSVGGFFENYIHALGAIPFMVLAPLLLIWFKTAVEASIFVVALTSFTSLFASVYTGLSTTDPRLLELGRILGANRLQVLTKLRWWAALPYLFSGLKGALPRAIFSAVVIEFLGTSRGLGYLMVSDGNNLDTAALFSDVIVLIIIIRGLLLIIRLVESRVLAWRPREHS